MGTSRRCSSPIWTRLLARQLPHPDEAWYALNGDIIATFSLQSMAEAHHSRAALATIALVHPPLPWGVVKTDHDNRVLRFEEAPRSTEPINAGVYVFGRGLVELLPERGDHERSTFPTLARRGHLYGYLMDGPWRAVDTDKDREAADELLAEHPAVGLVGWPQAPA